MAGNALVSLRSAVKLEEEEDPEDISEEDHAEPVQARLLMVCLVVVVSYF